MAIGSDRDPAMDKGFCQTFPIASLLAYKKHVEDNIKVKLKDLQSWTIVLIKSIDILGKYIQITSYRSPLLPHPMLS
jgi:hypothetical protein